MKSISRRLDPAMIDVLSVENMRDSDAAAISSGVPGRELMFRAASFIFENVPWKPPVAVVCGSGNNAGDGYALAGLLRRAGIPVEVIRLSDRVSADGEYYLARCLEEGVRVLPVGEIPPLSGYATVVDCIWGTGFRGTPAGAEKEAIEQINSSGAFVVSVDINSGLNGNSGLGDPCVLSDFSVSVGSFQPGHFLGRAKDVMKRKINGDIGIRPVRPPYHLLEAADLRPVFPPRLNNSHKGTYGYCALIGGSLRYPGAIRLASLANAAMRAGAGVARVALPRSLAHDLIPLILESTLLPLSEGEDMLVFREKEIAAAVAGTKSAAFGMGVGISEEGKKALEYLLDRYPGRLIVDADGLTMLASLPRARLASRSAPLILTPHLKEFSRLTGLPMEDILRAPVPAAEAYASETGAIVLLKGPATVITDGKTTYLTDTGCPGMATAGSGDVLSGILTALAASALDPLLAAAAAAWLNGAAGQLAQSRFGPVSMIASDTVSGIPEAIRQINEATHIE